MDVTATGPGPPRLEAPVLPPRLPDITNITGGPVTKPEDSIAPFLRVLADPGIRHLLEAVEHRAVPGPLFEEAVAAVGRRDFPHAFRALSELIETHPESVEQIVREPALAEVRNVVQALVEHATVNARTHAETTLLAAGHAVAMAPVTGGEMNPQLVLAVANRFYDAGQYVNYVRAAALGEAVIGYCGGTGPARKKSPVEFIGLVAALWERAPLLVLLAVWFSVGLIGGVVSWISGMNADPAFEIWGIGFLALVGFQFWATVRNRRFRPPTLPN